MLIRITRGQYGWKQPTGQIKAVGADFGYFELEDSKAARLIALNVAEAAPVQEAAPLPEKKPVAKKTTAKKKGGTNEL